MGNTEDGTAKEGENYEAQEGELIFNNEETSKTISLEIVDEESYEKNLIMYVNIGEPSCGDYIMRFSVTVLCLEALCAILILLARRHPAIDGELGGPKFFKTISSSIFVFFWCFYVMISALEMYDVIEPGF